MSEDARAFALKENASDSFVDAAVVVPPDGNTLRIGERLKEGQGVIVTSDPNEINALDGHDVLKSVSVPTKAARRAEKE